ncbi:MAG: TonB family protein [Muribaculaceae bacterium]|nr:TonB family protein [Muribaculaceae bacterium]
MGSCLVYTLYSGVFLLLLYLVYRLFISGEKQISLNRIILLGCYVVSFAAWPLSRLDWRHIDPQLPDSAPVIAIGELSLNTVGIIGDDSSVVPRILLWIYLAGASLVLLKTLFSTARLFFYIRKGTFIRKEGYTLVVMPGNDTAPFSFGHHIVMSAVDYETVRSSVTAHELAHIRCRHYLDLIVSQAACVVLWYNPASWLMRDELKLIHEYQADAEVIDSGVNIREYQMLLIRKTVGNRFHTLANSLNHSKLKNRIAMMQKENSSGRRRLRLLSLALAVDVALAVVNVPAVASGFDSIESVSLRFEDSSGNDVVSGSNHLDRHPDGLGSTSSVERQQKSENSVLSEKTTPVTSKDAVEVDRHNGAMSQENAIQKNVVAPEFSGGVEKLMQFLNKNIRYPQTAYEENRTGCPIVGFTVQEDGSVTDVKIMNGTWPDLDEEAMRVVRKMPKWIPGMRDGKVVSAEMFLPIDFRLQYNTLITERKTSGTSDDSDKNVYDESNTFVAGVIKKSVDPPSKSEDGLQDSESKTENSVYFTSNPKVKWYKAKKVGQGTSPNAPVYLDGVLIDKSKVKNVDPRSVKSVNVFPVSDMYPDGAVFITSEKGS